MPNITTKTSAGTLNGDELLYVVDDPGGTPADKTTTPAAIATYVDAAGAVATHAALASGVHGITAAGAALIDDANAAAQRTTLGLGTAATSNTGDFEAAGGIATHAALASGVHGITAAGAALIDDADATAQRATLGLGTAATGNTGSGNGLDADTVDGQHAAAFAASSHTHNASDINAGTLVHERGGLEADVSAYSGLVKISGGATSQAVAGRDYEVPLFPRPSSPSAYDSEFDNLTGWTLGSGVSAGTVDPDGKQSSAAVVDVATRPGWCLWQSNNATVIGRSIRKSIVLTTNCFVVARFMLEGYRGNHTVVVGAGMTGTPTALTDSEGQCNIQLDDSANPGNNNVKIGFYRRTTNLDVSLQASGADAGTAWAEQQPSTLAITHSLYLVIQKVGNNYYFRAFTEGGRCHYLGYHTKTGVTTLNQVQVGFSSDNSSIGLIQGIDFIRLYENTTEWAPLFAG